MRNPNIDTTTPEKEESDANPGRGREVERPQGPGETGPEMIPPGRVRTGHSGDADAGKGDGDDDERDGELDDSVDLPASDQDTGRHEQAAKAPTRGGADATDRGTRDPRR